MGPRPLKGALTRGDVYAVASLGRTQVIIIGGGINGIATFRDLALQGVDVVLIERNDFASGASAASSHMIHGGIRYLEYGEFRLVRESVRERNDLLRTAPHFVRPLETTIPIYSFFSGILSAPLRFLLHRSGRPSERGALLIKVGLVFYDVFSRGGREVPKHRFAGRRRTHRELPLLDPKARYSATYYDAGMADPERLALDVLLDGVAAHRGAHALNYVEVTGLERDGVRLTDRETGREFRLDADVVINATGPWADLTGAALGAPSGFVGGTKGSHIVVDDPELLAATRGREIFFEYDDGRIVLVYPIRDRVLIGTTDIEADPSHPAICTEEEVDYFLDLTRSVFPTVELDRSRIVYRYSGIRPLPAHDGPSGAVSRDYRIEETAASDTRPALLTLIGGKWTTFRALGETLGGHALRLLGRERRVDTFGLPIGGGRGYPADPARRSRWIERNLPGVHRQRADVLFQRYGTRALDVAAVIKDAVDRPLAGGLVSTGELAYLVGTERVVHLADVVFRRTDIAFAGRCDRTDIEELGAALAPLLGWNDFQLGGEIEDCIRSLIAHGAAMEGASMA